MSLNTEVEAINLLGNYFSNFIYCLDINDASNHNLKSLINYFSEYNQNPSNFKHTNELFDMIHEIAKQDSLLPRSLMQEFLNLNNKDMVLKYFSLETIKQELQLQDDTYNKFEFKIESPFRNMSNHTLVLDKNFLNYYPAKTVDDYKDELEQCLLMLKDYKVELPFLPNLLLKYEINPNVRGYLFPFNNHIGLINKEINIATFTHEFTHFIDYVLSPNRNYYSQEILDGQLNNKLPLLNQYIKNFDIITLPKKEKQNNFFQFMKYYFDIEVSSEQLTLGQLLPILKDNINNNQTIIDILKYTLTDGKPVKSLYSTMSEYMDILNKKDYFNDIIEKLARVSQCIVEEKNEVLVKEGLEKHRSILPLGTERNHYVSQWTNILSTEISPYINQSNNTLNNSHNHGTKLFDISKISLNRKSLHIMQNQPLTTVNNRKV